MRLFTVLIILLWAAVGAAAPVIDSVTGTIANGDTLVIVGSSFGTKSPAAPYLWAPFDTDINPSNLGTETSWQGTNGIAWDSDEGIGGSGCAKTSDVEGTWTAWVYDANFAWNDYDRKMYLFRKNKKNFDYRDYVWAENPNGMLNWKCWRMWEGPLAGGHNATMGTCNRSTLNNGVTVNPTDAGGTIPWAFPASNMANVVGPTNAWYNYEMIYQVNSSATSGVGDLGDGTFWAGGDGAVGIYAPYDNPDTRDFKVKDAATNPMRANWLIHEVCSPIDGHRFPADDDDTSGFWFDDVYADTVWSRVMLGDNNLWDDSTERDPQIPIYWNATGDTIKVIVNTGEYSADEEAYLFVFDATGDTSNAYQVIIDEEVSFGVLPCDSVWAEAGGG